MSKYQLSIYRVASPEDFLGEHARVEAALERFSVAVPGFSLRYAGYQYVVSLLGVLAPADAPWNAAVATLVYFARRIRSPYPSYIRIGLTASYGTDKFFVTVDGFPVYWSEGAGDVLDHKKIREFVRRRLALGSV